MKLVEDFLRFLYFVVRSESTLCKDCNIESALPLLHKKTQPSRKKILRVVLLILIRYSVFTRCPLEFLGCRILPWHTTRSSQDRVP